MTEKPDLAVQKKQGNPYSGIGTFSVEENLLLSYSQAES
jgi:hypothetical protein